MGILVALYFLSLTARKGALTFLGGIWPPWKLWYGSNFIVFSL